jgi:PilZ domain
VRRALRFPMHLQVDDAFRSSGEVFDVVALNLSVNGLLLESSKLLAVGEDVNFAFHLPQDAGLVTGAGTVVRQGSGIGQFGVELTHVEGDGRVRIKRFVESFGSSAAAV